MEPQLKWFSQKKECVCAIFFIFTTMYVPIPNFGAQVEMTPGQVGRIRYDKQNGKVRVMFPLCCNKPENNTSQQWFWKKLTRRIIRRTKTRAGENIS